MAIKLLAQWCLMGYRWSGEQFRRSIALNPQYVVAYGNMGNAFFRAGQYEEAIKCFRAQLQADQANRNNIPNLVAAYEQAGKRDSARIYKGMMQ